MPHAARRDAGIRHIGEHFAYLTSRADFNRHARALANNAASGREAAVGGKSRRHA
jgi:hypothetical protein